MSTEVWIAARHQAAIQIRSTADPAADAVAGRVLIHRDTYSRAWLHSESQNIWGRWYYLSVGMAQGYVRVEAVHWKPLQDDTPTMAQLADILYQSVE